MFPALRPQGEGLRHGVRMEVYCDCCREVQARRTFCQNLLTFSQLFDGDCFSLSFVRSPHYRGTVSIANVFIPARIANSNKARVILMRTTAVGCFANGKSLIAKKAGETSFIYRIFMYFLSTKTLSFFCLVLECQDIRIFFIFRFCLCLLYFKFHLNLVELCLIVLEILLFLCKLLLELRVLDFL